MKRKWAIIILGMALALAGLAARLSASTIRYAGPVEVRVKETLSSTEYYTTRRRGGAGRGGRRRLAGAVAGAGHSLHAR